MIESKLESRNALRLFKIYFVVYGLLDNMFFNVPGSLKYVARIAIINAVMNTPESNQQPRFELDEDAYQACRREDLEWNI